MKRFRIVQIHGDQRREFEFTAAQARDLGIAAEARSNVTVAYLMDGVFAWRQAAEGSDVVCPVCGTTHREVILYHRVGCEECYRVFDRTIDRIRSRSGRSVVFEGRIPDRLERYRRLFVRREHLMSRLDTAVETEDYESAALYRDQLNELATEDDA